MEGGLNAVGLPCFRCNANGAKGFALQELMQRKICVADTLQRNEAEGVKCWRKATGIGNERGSERNLRAQACPICVGAGVLEWAGFVTRT